MTSTSPRTSDSVLADLADTIRILGQRLDLRHPAVRDVVPLTGTELAVIREVLRRPGSSPSQIAEATDLQRSNVSTAIRTLASGGLLTRENDPHNARSVTVTATPLAQEYSRRIRSYSAEVLREADPAVLAEATQALRALEGLAASLARHD